jgi:hypothetical protein
MGLCCSSSRSAAGSHDDNEAPATAVQGEANKAAAVPRCPTPLHMPAAARHATEPAAAAEVSLSEPAANSAAAHPPDKLVADRAFKAEPSVDGLPSFWSRKGGSDGDLIEGEVEIYGGPSGTLQGHHTLLTSCFTFVTAI